MTQERRPLLDALRGLLPPAARNALDLAVSMAGRRGEALFLVGGGVRDLLLGSTHLDLDLVLEGDALALAGAVASGPGARLVRHPRFGTAVLHGEGYRLDFARARSERYDRPGALPTVQPGTLTDDLARRDFSINALALRLTAPAGELIDPHDGRADLDRRLVRVLHDGSFRDDATRILRAARYAGRLEFRIEAHTEALLRRDLSYLDTIGGVRIRHELERIALEERVGEVLRLALGLGVLPAVHAALRPGDRELRAAARLADVPASHRDAALFALLLAGAPEPEAEGAIGRLALTGRQAAAVRGLRLLLEREQSLGQPTLRPSDAVAMLTAHPVEAVEAFALLATPPAAGRAREYLHHWRFLRPRLDGHDVEQLGVPHGPRVGEALAALRRARLDGEVTTRADEVRLVGSMFAGRSAVGARGG